MSILLRVGLPAGRKWGEAENAKVFNRNISGLMLNDEMCSMNGIVDFLRFKSKIVYRLYII